MIHFNITLRPTPRSSKKRLPFRFYDQKFVLIYELYHTCYVIPLHCVCTRVTFISTKEPTLTPVGGTAILCSYCTPFCTLSRNSRKPLLILRLILVRTLYNTNKIKHWYTNYKTYYLHQCIVLKIFYTLKPSTHIKINFKKLLKNYSNMFRSHWTIIREHVVPIPKLPLIVY